MAKRKHSKKSVPGPRRADGAAANVPPVSNDGARKASGTKPRDYDAMREGIWRRYAKTLDRLAK